MWAAFTTVHAGLKTCTGPESESSSCLFLLFSTEWLKLFCSIICTEITVNHISIYNGTGNHKPYNFSQVFYFPNLGIKATQQLWQFKKAIDSSTYICYRLIAVLMGRGCWKEIKQCKFDCTSIIIRQGCVQPSWRLLHCCPSFLTAVYP